MGAISWALLFVSSLALGSSRVEGVGGRNASRGDFPWQAALYRKLQNDNKWQQACGATLIHQRLLLTAAHCVTNLQKTLQPQEVMVKLGQMQKNYYKNESSTVLKQVKKILVPERFMGITQNYAFNVALMELTDNVKVSSNVRPTRLDWQGKVTLQNGQRLKLSGWNRDANSLLWTPLKFLEFKECSKKLRPSRQQFLTFDKFCMESSQERDLRGFSGGAVHVVEDGLDYVIGTLSNQLNSGSYEEETLSGTNVTTPEIRSWLQDQLKGLDLLDETLNWSSSTEYLASQPFDDYE